MYIVKIKGKDKIPDYVQLRDNEFTLVAYFRLDRPEKALEKCGYGEKIEEVKKFLDSIPFGKVSPFNI